jgi:hypothetical protein
MRRFIYLLALLGCGCSSTPDTAPEVESVYDAEGNLKHNLSSGRSWEEQQELMKDMKDSLKKQPPVDASGPIKEMPKKK